MRKFFIILFGIIAILITLAGTAGCMLVVLAVMIIRIMLIVVSGGKVGGKY